MTLRQYILTMLLATILCWVAWCFVLFNVDPFQSATIGFIFFYVSLFFALVGTISILAFFLYRLLGSKKLPMFRHVQLSFRQSVLLSGFIILFLYLQGSQLLTFWNSLVLLTVFVLILSFTLSLKRNTNIQIHTNNTNGC